MPKESKTRINLNDNGNSADIKTSVVSDMSDKNGVNKNLAID
jgi:hypothetical protein